MGKNDKKKNQTDCGILLADCVRLYDKKTVFKTIYFNAYGFLNNSQYTGFFFID